MMPLLIAGEAEATARSRAEELLAGVGLAGRMTHRPSQLSGGEQQRTAVARALAADPCVVLADEPSGNLDHANSERLHDLFAAPGPGARDGAGGGDPQPSAGGAGRPGAVPGGRTAGAAARRGVDALMSCDQCREREAVVHLTQIVNEQVTTLHLCEQCAAEKGVESPGARRQDAAGRLPRGHGQGACRAGAVAAPDGDVCARCGGTLQDFRETGRLGCADCYRSFEAPLRDLLRRLHGSTHHMGERYADRGSEPAPRSRGHAGCELREQLRLRGGDRELRAGRGAARPAAGAGMIDLCLLPDGGWAGSTRAARPATWCSRRGSGWRGTSPAVRSPGRNARDASGRRFCTVVERRPRRDDRCSAGRTSSGSTGWTGPTGSCCTSGTW